MITVDGRTIGHMREL